MRKLILPLLLIIIVSCNPKVSNNGNTQIVIYRIDSSMAQLTAQSKFSGNLLIANKGHVVFKKSYGYANFETKEEMSPEKIFQIASISKQFTATGIMILKENGKLNYDDYVSMYLSDFPYKEVTIRQLMNHTSGIPDFFDGILPLFDTTKQNGNAELYDIIVKNKLPLIFPSGEKWAYCNVAYEILADIIAKVSGEKYNDFLTEYIFKPLQMNDTQSKTTYIPLANIENSVLGYIYLSDKDIITMAHDLPRNRVVYHLAKMEGDGSIYSSVDDLLKWDQALYTDKVVKQKTLEDAFEPSMYNNGDTVITEWSSMYGFGWDISLNDRYGKIVNHGGGQAGYRSKIIRYIEHNVTLIFLSNMDNDDFWTYTGEIAEMYANEVIAPTEIE